MTHRPIVHGGFTNELSEKCRMCGNRIYNPETSKWECCNREDGKFVPAIAYTCYKRVDSKPNPLKIKKV